jgi:NAD-dependent dihydropyrimidine dehydrogenase PreA subunit
MAKNCQAEPGRSVIVVDRARCEGKAECLTVCPFGVFEVRRMDDADFAALPMLARLKSRVHGRKTAYAASDKCQACRKCIAACPENAIELRTT